MAEDARRTGKAEPQERPHAAPASERTPGVDGDQPAAHRPAWAPEGGGAEFTSRVLPGGGPGGHDGQPGPAVESDPSASATGGGRDERPARRRTLTAAQYAEGVLGGDRALLGRAITLVESNAPAHMTLAQEVLAHLLPHTGGAMRVGVTGVPGVGKSTFIEALGTWLLGQGRRVAVLAIDPSSAVTRGSILGDKTRMERLARDPRCFIRPSPSGGALGGVARKTRETILVCEAAGFDVVLVETVGVGQSEITVRGLVDFFLLLLLPGAGDELQGIKKGIVEMADAILINKADGDNRVRADAARQEYARALHYLSPARPDWQAPVATCSALTGEGVEASWAVVEAFREATQATGSFAAQRRDQTLGWVRQMVDAHLRASFHAHPAVREALPELERQVAEGQIPPTAAVTRLIELFGGRA